MRPVQEEVSQALTDAAKNWIAMDGLWFQAVEQAYGMDAALALDREVWEQFAVIEAQRIKEQLALPEKGGLDALEIALKNRLVSLINQLEISRPDEKTLIVTLKTCRVQAARKEKICRSFPANQSDWSNFRCLPAPSMPGLSLRACPAHRNHYPGHHTVHGSSRSKEQSDQLKAAGYWTVEDLFSERRERLCFSRQV